MVTMLCCVCHDVADVDVGRESGNDCYLLA